MRWDNKEGRNNRMSRYKYELETLGMAVIWEYGRNNDKNICIQIMQAMYSYRKAKHGSYDERQEFTTS
jgi:hypothetical protein